MTIKYNMQTVLANEIINSLNTTILVWIRALNTYSLDVLQRRPSQYEWSLGQVYQHIIDDTNFFMSRPRPL